LQSIVFDKGVLDGVEVVTISQPFNGQHRFALNIRYRHLARTHGHVIHENRAGPTIPLTAAEFGAGEIKIRAQDV
jgi:hypothetical protein